MIYLIIGGTCCGKTSFVKNTWLKGRAFEAKKDILHYVETEEVIILGKWSNIDGRERSGTDTISRSQIHLIGEQVKSLLKHNKDIVVEGDKATFRKVFNELLEVGPIKLFHITSTIDKIIDRYYTNGSSSSLSSVKASRTKAANIFMEYKDMMNGEEVDTSGLNEEDFKTLSLYNYKQYQKENDTIKLF
jgi:hypothetical protein